MLQVEHLTKSYSVANGRHYVFRDVSLDFPDNSNIGIIGPNGAGKSTLLRILGGIDYADSGRINTDQTFSWPLGLRGGFVPHLTGRENCRMVCNLYGIKPRDIRKRMEYIKELTQIGEYFDEPVMFYSSGMGSRLGFALSMAFDFDYFLIDEITSVGDAQFKQLAKGVLQEKAKRSKVIMVSHSMNDIKSFCDVGVLVKDGDIRLFDTLDDAIAEYLPKSKKAEGADEIINQKIQLSEINIDQNQTEGEGIRIRIAALLEKLEDDLLTNEEIEYSKPEYLHIRLGNIYKQLYHPLKAIEHYEKAAEIDGFNLSPHVLIAELAMGLNNEALFNTHVDLAKKLDHESPVLNRVMARYYLRNGELLKAEKAQIIVLESYPKNAIDWFTMGQIYWALQKPDETIDALIKSISFKEDNPAAYRQLCSALFSIGAELPALEARHKSLTIVPKDKDELLRYQSIIDELIALEGIISG